MNMIIEKIKQLDYEHKMFYLFLLIHLCVWVGVALVRTVLPTDALEGIYWGYLHDFGTPKHPPLSGWIAYLTYTIFPKDFSIYFISQTCVILGFIYIYKIARQFLDVNKSMLSVIILEGCWVYTYITGYYGFNPDVILLFLLPLITYYFYQCVTRNKPSDWIKLGLFTGISFLNKYQTALIIVAFAVWALFFKRDVFKNKFFYIAVLIAFVVFLPHLIWLFKYDFFPLLYFEGELADDNWLHHIMAPIIFAIMQFSLIAGSLAIFALLKFKQKSKFQFIENYNNKDLWFLLMITFIPLIIHVFMGFIVGGTMRPRWGFEFLYLTGIILFYCFPTKIERDDFKFVIKFSYTAMVITLLALGTLLVVEKNYRSRYPVETIYNDMLNAWHSQYNTPLKYIGGYIEWTLPLTIYSKDHPDCILDTNGYKNPWIDENDLKKSGILIIDRNEKDITEQLYKSCPYLPKDYQPVLHPYKFFVKNALNMPREYSIYYIIIPPEEQ